MSVHSEGLPVPILSILSPVLSGCFVLFRELLENDIIVNTSAIIDWENDTLEQEWHIRNKIGTPKLKSLVSRIKRQEDIVIKPVISALGSTFHDGKNLFETGIMSLVDKTLRIKIGKILQLRSGEIVIIKFTNSIDKSLYGNMCEKTINRQPLRLSNLTKFSFSVVLNRADLWLKDFESIEFRNIIVPFQIHLDNSTIENLLPEELKQKILIHANAALRSRRDSLHYIEQFNNNIFNFLQSKLNIELSSIIRIESSAGNAIIRKSELKLQYYKIGNGYDVSLPNAFSVEISCSLRGNEHALKGEVLFYHHDFRTFLSDSLKEFANNIQ